MSKNEIMNSMSKDEQIKKTKPKKLTEAEIKAIEKARQNIIKSQQIVKK